MFVLGVRYGELYYISPLTTRTEMPCYIRMKIILLRNVFQKLKSKLNSTNTIVNIPCMSITFLNIFVIRINLFVFFFVHFQIFWYVYLIFFLILRYIL